MSQTIPPAEYTAEQRRLARSTYLKLIGGAGKAGGDNEWYHEADFCLHFVRRASEADRSRLGELIEKALEGPAPEVRH